MPRQGLDTERVLDAAVELADEGLDQLSFARLAERLQVRPPSLYNHVDGRAALMRLITLRGLDELSEVIATAAAGRAGEDALRATAHAYRDYARAHPGVYEATLAAVVAPDPELHAAADRLLGLLRAILRGWQLDGDEAVDAIRAIRSAMHGFVALERAGGFAMPRDVDASFDAMIDTLGAGIAQRAASVRSSCAQP